MSRNNLNRRSVRNRSQPKFNMISLMDIFTILVFFLLASSSNVQVANSKLVELPNSIADQKPREALVILVSQEDVYVQGKSVVSVESIIAQNESSIPELKSELELLKSLRRYEIEPEGGHEVIISADKGVPFGTLKKIMSTCTEEGFYRISLSVIEKAVEK